MNETQALATLRAHQAAHKKTEGPIEWWWSANGYWLALTRAGGVVSLRKVAGKCSC